MVQAWSRLAAIAALVVSCCAGLAGAQTGRCCNAGNCTITTSAACTSPATWNASYTCSPNTCQTVGPDIIVGQFTDVGNNATSTINSVVYDSFAVGTASCNKGNQEINWWDNSTSGSYENRHPVISQNIFRYSPSTGRFEHLGEGSLKHGFSALQQ